MMTQPYLEIDGLYVTYSRLGQDLAALANINLSVSPGEWLFVLGHNGSGKSTLLATVSGQVKPDRGDVLIGNVPAAQCTDLVFSVYQNPLLATSPNLSLFENLYVADTSLNGWHSRRALRQRYDTHLEPLGLAGRLDQLSRTLSGGERQLLSLSMAARRSSPILLLDEPFSALDPHKAKLCVEQIKELNREGRTVIQVTHDPNLALRYATRIIVLREGSIVLDANSDDLRIEQLLTLLSREI